MGYTLNRITLFALIFSIGILVDDAIVVVENIYRHLKMGDRAPERGGGGGGGRGGQPHHPRHLHGDRRHPAHGLRLRADGAVHAADPGGRLGGHAGLAGGGLRGHAVPGAAGCCSGHVGPADAARTTAPTSPRRRAASPASTRGVMAPLMERPPAALRLLRRRSWLLLLALRGAGGGAAGAGEDAPLRQQERVPGGARPAGGHHAGDQRSRRPARSPPISSDVPEVESTQVYAGTAAPFNFNGLVRHYFMRRGANVADVQVNLTPKDERDAAEPRRSPWRCGRASTPSPRVYGASAKIAEIPPGPPVLSTLVAEVYAADDARAPGGRRAR